MPGPVKIRPDQAPDKLRIGPLGVGEHHEKPAARQFVVDLINQGLVKVLFVEIPHDQGRIYDTSLAKATLAKQGGRLDAEVLGYLQLTDGLLKAPGGVVFSRLILHAMKASVRIVYCDKFIVRARNAGSSEHMNSRNRTVNEILEEASFQSKSPQRAGCLILFGAEHFESDDNSLKVFIGQSDTDEFPWVDLSN